MGTLHTILKYLARTIVIMAILSLSMFTCLFSLYMYSIENYIAAILWGLANYIVMGRVLIDHYNNVFDRWFR